MIFSRPTTLTDALRHQTLKRALALSPDIGSREIQEFIPAQIRDRSFFSAKTPYAEYLSDVNVQIGRLVQPDVRIGPDGLVPTASGESISPAQVRARMKQTLAALGYQPDPEKRGGLQDLSSDRRVNLIIDTQLKMSRGYGSWRQAQDETVLDLWPADEMYRAMTRREHRDWDRTWNDARRALGEATTATVARDRDSGPFVARKNDPIWAQISRFRNPFPPFDFGSGMRVRDVSRDRAEALGVIGSTQTVSPELDPMNRPYSLDMQDTRSDIAAALQAAFGDQAMMDGGKLHIMPDPQETLKELMFRAASGEQATGAFAFVTATQRAGIARAIGRDLAPGATMDIDAAHITHIRQRHGGEAERMRGHAPVFDDDIGRLDRIVKTGAPRRPTEAEKSDATPVDVTLDCEGGFRVGASYSGKLNRVLVRTMYRAGGWE